MTLQRTSIAPVSKKPRKCDWCREHFTRSRMGQKCCTPKCAIAWAKNEQVKRDCAPYRAKPAKNSKEKRELNENSKHHVSAQLKAYLHRWIKWRDRGRVCMACQKPMTHLPQHAIHASHFRPSGSKSAIRYEEDNIWLCDSGCNSNNAGNLIDYRINLVKEIGLERVKWLEAQNHVKKWTIEELRELRDDYKSRLKALDIALPRVHK